MQRRISKRDALGSFGYPRDSVLEREVLIRRIEADALRFCLELRESMPTIKKCCERIRATPPVETAGPNTSSTIDKETVEGTGTRAPAIGASVSPVILRKKCTAGTRMAGSAPRAASAAGCPGPTPPGAPAWNCMSDQTDWRWR
jgi:hypothetical protein